MTPRVIQLQEGVWEIVDELGNSVFSTHCQDCGNQFFFGDLRLLKYVVVCKSCKDIRNAPAMTGREEVIQRSALDKKITIRCKNFEKCGEMMVRSQFRDVAVCHPCKQAEQRVREIRSRKSYV